MPPVAVVSPTDLLAAVRHWAGRPWPIAQTGVPRLAAEIGWSMVPGNDEFFRTTFPISDAGGAAFAERGTVGSVYFKVTDHVRNPDDDATNQLEQAWTDVVTALTGEWGEPTYGVEFGDRYAAWTTEYRTQIRTSVGRNSAVVEILAPHLVMQRST